MESGDTTGLDPVALTRREGSSPFVPTILEAFQSGFESQGEYHSPLSQLVEESASKTVKLGFESLEGYQFVKIK